MGGAYIEDEGRAVAQSADREAGQHRGGGQWTGVEPEAEAEIYGARDEALRERGLRGSESVDDGRQRVVRSPRDARK